MLFSDDVRPNKNVSMLQAKAIASMALDEAADTEGVVCQSITEHIANKYNLGSAPKIAYGVTSIGRYGCGINYSSAGFTTPPTVVCVPLVFSSTTYNEAPPPLWLGNVTATSALVNTWDNHGYSSVHWMAIGT